MELATLLRPQIVPFVFYVQRQSVREMMSLGNADTVFISNYDHNYDDMVHIQSFV